MPSESAACPSRSPESLTRCVLSDDAESHLAGHESALSGRHGGERVSWATAPVDHERWQRQEDR